MEIQYNDLNWKALLDGFIVIVKNEQETEKRKRKKMIRLEPRLYTTSAREQAGCDRANIGPGLYAGSDLYYVFSLISVEMTFCRDVTHALTRIPPIFILLICLWFFCHDRSEWLEEDIQVAFITKKASSGKISHILKAVSSEWCNKIIYEPSIGKICLQGLRLTSSTSSAAPNGEYCDLMYRIPDESIMQ